MKALPRSLFLFAIVYAYPCLRPTIAVAAQSDAPILAWKEVTPVTQLPPRTFFASTFDPVSNKVLVFGGSTVSGQSDDTWTFDGKTWTQIQTGVAPGPRAAAAMAYDSATQKVVLFGGFVGLTLLNDTWLWDGATSTWTKANPRHVPVAATNPMLFTDPLNGHTDMFGGYQGFFYSRSMWQWTGNDWQLLNPTTTPYPRSGAVTVYDPVRNNVVLFGGISDNWIIQNTWTWDGLDWTLRNPKTQPPPLSIQLQIRCWSSAVVAKEWIRTRLGLGMVALGDFFRRA